MATTLGRDLRPDTQPELPILAHLSPSISASRYETVRLWADSLVRRPTAAPQPLPAAQPYTLRLLIADTFGANARPGAFGGRAPTTRLQRLLVGTLGARLGVTKWAPALAGGGLAAALGLVACVLVQLVCNAALATLAPQLSDPVTGFVERNLMALLGGSPATLFALANLAPVLLASGLGPGAVGHMQFSPPLLSLALVPMLALVLGGALAASGDFARRARYSVARGALVGPVYALLLTLLTVLGGSRFDGAPLGLGGTALLVATPNMTLLYGLLWGTLFGALGGWIQLYRRRSLAEALERLAHLRFRRLIGSVIGAVVALGYGLGGSTAVALVALVAMLATGHAPQPLVNAGQVTHLGGSVEGVLGVALLALLLAPSLAIWVYAYLSGASIDVDRVTFAPPGAFGSDFTSFGLGAAHGPWHPAWYLLALLPIACYFVGGRVAARFARADSRRRAFVAGALVALPLAALTLLLDTLATLSLQVHVAAGMLIADVAPSATHNLLPILVVAALVAGLGGLSTVPSVTGTVTRARREASESPDGRAAGGAGTPASSRE